MSRNIWIVEIPKGDFFIEFQYYSLEYLALEWFTRYFSQYFRDWNLLGPVLLSKVIYSIFLIHKKVKDENIQWYFYHFFEKISIIDLNMCIFSPQINKFSWQMEYSKSDLVVVIRRLDYWGRVGTLNLQK